MLRCPIALVTALAIAAPAMAQTPAPDVQAKVAARDAATLKQFPPPGRLVDVGGRKLHIFCEGEGKGPTVIMETGAVASSLYYRKAQDAVAKVARVCSYDRAGQGWSDPPAAYPRSLEARADDLHALLKAAKIKGPYVLAAHSMGGLLARLYAKKHPKEVAGVVLLESSEEGFNGDATNVTRVAATSKALAQAVTAAANGIDIPMLRVPNGPPEQAVALRASVYRAGQDDMEAMSKLNEEIARLGGLGRLGDIPLVVVRRGRTEALMTPQQNAAWIEAQGRLAKLSTRSEPWVAENSGHNIQYDEPEIVARAVVRVLEMRRR